MTIAVCVALLLAALVIPNILFGAAVSDFDAEIGLATGKSERDSLPWRDFGGKLLPLSLFTLGLPMAMLSPWEGGALMAIAAVSFFSISILFPFIRRRGGKARGDERPV